MDDLLAARSQMAMSLAFHILFAVAGIGMPFMMVIAEGLAHRTGDRGWLVLAKRWAKGTAVLFAVGAVSGTVLSFELGLLWPGFMQRAGAVIGLPFSMEGFAFFLEAIFLGLYLYGWQRLSARVHLFCGVMVALSGALSGAFVVTANAWMNTPAGFAVAADGSFTDLDPIAAMFNPAAPTQAVHMTLAALVAVGFVVAAIHARALLKDPTEAFHRKAFAISGALAAVSIALQMLSGHASAQHVFEHQPIKGAAMEGHWKTQGCAPLTVGGWPDEAAEITRWGVELPCGLSLLAFNDPHAQVMGLSDVPADQRPPVAPVHVAFQLMVGLGTAMMAVAALGVALAIKRRCLPLDPWLLRLVVLTGPMGLIAVEAGWTVTEVGRQPWIIYEIMRTSEAVTPVQGLDLTFLSFSGLYLLLGLVVVKILRQQVFAGADPLEDAPHA